MKNIDLFNTIKFRDYVKSLIISEGHFKLSSGYHSNLYCQVSRIFENPETAQRVTEMFLSYNKIKQGDFDLVVSPAMGGILFGYELSRQISTPNIFFERVGGMFTLRRGFKILNEHKKILIIEDVITTGKSFNEIRDKINILLDKSDVSIKVGCLIDRSGSGLSDYSLFKLNIDKWLPEDCPMCLENLPVETQGSRFL